jgi:GxxExxY protein
VDKAVRILTGLTRLTGFSKKRIKRLGTYLNDKKVSKSWGHKNPVNLVNPVKKSFQPNTVNQTKHMNPPTTTTDELTRKIIGAAMKVHSNLGFGFVESVYENSLAYELRKAGLKAEQQVAVKVLYDGIVVGDFKADLVVNEEVVLELKAVEKASAVHEVQLVNYLNGIGKDVGLLLNFGARSLEFKRKYRRPKEESNNISSSGSIGLLAVIAGKLLGHF